MKKEFNKLVRDKVPNIIIGKSYPFKARKCTDDEFPIELGNKLIEESNEIKEAINKYLTSEEKDNPEIKEKLLNNIIEELVDLKEVELTIQKLFYISSDSINTVANLKRSSKGSFEDKIFLEWVEKPDDN
jgi:predicted house-cleaning noncanonical NTP pyrophosphatase (MazG superfamily)